MISKYYEIEKFKNKTILSVGEIKPRKGYHFLIKVLEKKFGYET